MRLTKKKAVEYSIELWEWLAETGKRKEDWQGWERFGGLDEDDECKEVACECFLCEYDKQQVGAEEKCDSCPYDKEFGFCCVGDNPYKLWAWAGQIRTRKKYAKLFLEQLKALK